MSIAIPPFGGSGGGEPCALRLTEDIDVGEGLTGSDLPIHITADYGGVLIITTCVNSNNDIAVPNISIPDLNSFGSQDNLLGGESYTGAIKLNGGGGSWSGSFNRALFCKGPIGEWGCGGFDFYDANWAVSIPSGETVQRVDLSTKWSRKYGGYVFEIPFASKIDIEWSWNNATISRPLYGAVFKYIPISQDGYHH